VYAGVMLNMIYADEQMFYCRTAFVALDGCAFQVLKVVHKR